MRYAAHQRGFIALMSVIIIGAVMTMMMFTLGTSGFFARFDTLGSENKAASQALAEGCIAAATLELAQDAAYQPVAGGECVTLGGSCGGADPQKVCKVCQVITSGNELAIRARALYNGSYTNLAVTGTLGVNDFSVSNWSEVPTYIGASCPLP